MATKTDPNKKLKSALKKKAADNKKKGNKKPSMKSKSKSKSKTSSKTTSTKMDMYDPRTLLTGDLLKKYAKAQVKMQVKPELNAAKRYADSLKGLLNHQVKQQEKLGNQAASNISGYYQNFANTNAQNVAKQEATGARLRGEVAAAGSQGQAASNAAGDEALAGLTRDEQLRQNAPSSARDELQQMIAANKSRTASESSAQNANASGQAADWESAMRMMGGAAGMTGGAQVSDARKQTNSNVMDLYQQYLPDLREAQGSIKDIKSQKGAMMVEAINSLLGREREYGLSKAALNIDKESLKVDAKSGNSQMALAKQYAKNKKKEQMRSLANQLKVAKKQGNIKKQQMLQSKINQLEVAAAQAGNAKADDKRSRDYLEASQGGTGKNKPLSEYTSKQRADAKQRVKQVIDADPTFLSTKENQQKLINRLLNSYHINPQLTKHYIKKLKSKQPGGAETAAAIGLAALNAII